MKLGLMNLDRMLIPIFEQQIKGAYNAISYEFVQDKLRETLSRSKAMTKKNHRNFESDSKRSEVMSERNLITERFKLNHNIGSGIDGNMIDAMSLPDENVQERVTTGAEVKLQLIPRLSGLQNTLVTKTQDNGWLGFYCRRFQEKRIQHPREKWWWKKC
jgi:hypothetical protein